MLVLIHPCLCHQHLMLLPRCSLLREVFVEVYRSLQFDARISIAAALTYRRLEHLVGPLVYLVQLVQRILDLFSLGLLELA